MRKYKLIVFPWVSILIALLPSCISMHSFILTYFATKRQRYTVFRSYFNRENADKICIYKLENGVSFFSLLINSEYIDDNIIVH